MQTRTRDFVQSYTKDGKAGLAGGKMLGFSHSGSIGYETFYLALDWNPA